MFAQRRQQSEWAENPNGGDVEQPHDRFLITLPLSPYRIPVDDRTAIPYTLWMIIRSVQHKGLVRFIEDDDSRELRPDLVKRLRNILAVLILPPT